MRNQKLQMPTVLGLNGLKIRIKYVDHISEFGLFCPTTKDILVSTNHHQSRDHVYETIFHELLHAALDHAGLSKLCVDISENFEEAIVTALEHALKDTVALEKTAWLETSSVAFKFKEQDDS